jgi:hypothetical protein
MANFFRSASSAWRLAALVNPTQKLTTVLLSLSLAGGLAALMAQSSNAQGSESPKPAQPTQMADGVYLYGQSAQPQTVGSEYLVFEVTQGAVVGGFYMPSSSFDCFHGNLQADKLALTVVDSYERTPHPYSVALAAGEPVATIGGSATPLGLEGYHQISHLSEIDHQILTTCKADQRR